MENQEIHHPHDKGYKTLLSSKKAFLDLLRGFIREGWVEQIEENHLTRVDKSYILQDFSEKEADIVYWGKFKDQEVIFYILLELQSTIDYQMPYRLLLYMTEIWREYLRDQESDKKSKVNFRLPPIIPMVLYNGEFPWTVTKSFRQYQSGYEWFGDRLLDFRYELLDVNQYTEDELLDITNLMGLVFLLDQNIDQEEFFRRIRNMAKALKSIDKNEFILFRSWVLNILTRNMKSDDKRKVRDVIESYEEGEEMMHNLERLYYEFKEEGIMKGREEGREKGREEGKEEKALEIARNLIEMGMPFISIAKATGLTEEEVKNLRKNMS